MEPVVQAAFAPVVEEAGGGQDGGSLSHKAAPDCRQPSGSENGPAL